MKVKIVEGCTAWNTIVDEKDLNDHSKEELEVVYDKILSAIKSALIRNEVSFTSIMNVLPYSDYESDNCSCEQCGDSVVVTTWEI